MKRSHSLVDEEDDNSHVEDNNLSRSKGVVKRVRRASLSDQQPSEDDLVRLSDTHVMQEIQTKLHENGTTTIDDMNDTRAMSANLHKQLQETRQSYYVSYMKKVMEKLPLGKNILSTIQEDLSQSDDSPSSFYRMFSVAKMVVHSEMQCKKLKAFNAVFDMVNGLAGRYVHDRVIVPSLGRYVPETQLHNAFHAYQTALSEEDDSNQLELQCIAYLIQTELEKKEALKVPHPMYNRFSQQMKAVSQYVIHLLAAASTMEQQKHQLQPPTNKNVYSSQESISSGEHREIQDGEAAPLVKPAAVVAEGKIKKHRSREKFIEMKL